jgi:thiamine-phosphate diphosphorylase
VSPVVVPTLHLITSRRRLAPDARTTRAELAALDAQIDEAIEAGVDVVQIRERDLDAGVLRRLVASAVTRTTATTRIVVSDRVDVAVAAGAAGVHLPAAGLPASLVRLLWPGLIVGRSIHGQDRPDDRDACDYLMFGTVFASESKGEGSVVAGLGGLRQAVITLERPVVAIGGVSPERARACLETGASGVAAIGAFLPAGLARDASGVHAATEAFRAAMRV